MRRHFHADQRLVESPDRQIRSRNGRCQRYDPLIPRTEIEGVLAGSVDLYHADLNADIEDDYITVTFMGGVGLA